MKIPPRTPRNNALPEGAPQWYSRGYLPHFDMAEMTQTLTFRLFDSMPQTVLEMWEAEWSLLPKIDGDKERRKRIDAYLDKGYGSCFLRENALAEIVQNALLYFDGQRYALHAWIVMPNHVHTLFTAKPGFELGKIAHSWKSFTATECNRMLGRTGNFWQREPLIVTSATNSIL